MLTMIILDVEILAVIIHSIFLMYSPDGLWFKRWGLCGDKVGVGVESCKIMLHGYSRQRRTIGSSSPTAVSVVPTVDIFSPQ